MTHCIVNGPRFSPGISRTEKCGRIFRVPTCADCDGNRTMLDDIIKQLKLHAAALLFAIFNRPNRLIGCWRNPPYQQLLDSSGTPNDSGIVYCATANRCALAEKPTNDGSSVGLSRGNDLGTNRNLKRLARCARSSARRSRSGWVLQPNVRSFSSRSAEELEGYYRKRTPGSDVWRECVCSSLWAMW